MKKLVSLLTVIVLVAVLATAAFATETPALEIADVESAAGAEVVMNINIVNNPGTTLGEFVFNFDTTALEFVSAAYVGGEGWDWMVIINDDTTNAKFGSVVFSASDGVLEGDCTLVTLTLKVKDDVKPGKYAVNAVVDFIGDDDADFIVGETFTGYVVIPCTDHAWDEGTVKTPATCTEDGVMVYTCTYCGATKEEAITATGHAWGEWTETTAPGCGTAGEESRTCANCGEVETREVAALEHAWGEWTVTTEATCCTDGLQTRTCANCGKTEEEVIAANGEHTWNDGEVKVEATCCEDGVMVYTCVNGTATKEETIPATGEHKVAYKDNEDGETHTVYCENSGNVLDPAEAHTFGDYVEDTENPGWKYQECVYCGYIHKESPETGDNTMIAVAMATVSMMGIALVVSKKKEF